jgi:hypothetical protein
MSLDGTIEIEATIVVPGRGLVVTIKRPDDVTERRQLRRYIGQTLTVDGVERLVTGVEFTDKFGFGLGDTLGLLTRPLPSEEIS